MKSLNKFRIYQMIGNVWEWCLNPQGIDLKEFQLKSSLEFYHEFSHNDAERYAIRGGSFLCHESYCKRYRIAAARNGNTGDSASNNTGFRTVKDI